MPPQIKKIRKIVRKRKNLISYVLDAFNDYIHDCDLYDLGMAIIDFISEDKELDEREAKYITCIVFICHFLELSVRDFNKILRHVDRT